MRTGKDSVAALLEKFGYTRISFADPLRKMALDIDPSISLVGAPDAILEAFDGPKTIYYSELLTSVGYERDKEVPDFRRFLQRLGTEGVRDNFGENAWVNLFLDQVEKAPADQKFVVPDVRFPNEARAIHALGGEVWRTLRPGYGGGTHPSESMIEEITPDVVLEADNLIDLGKLVLREIGEADTSILAPWADSILSLA
jgi:hypothetical protein